VAELRKDESHRKLPVVVLTSKDITQEDRRRLTGSVELILQKGAASRETILTEIRSLMKTTAAAAATVKE
jgi:CheY-like chemotaxis protein